MSEEFDDRIRRSVEQVPVPEPAPMEQVARHARRIRVRRYVSGAVTAAVVVGAAIGVPAGLLTSLRGGPGGGPTVVGRAAGQTPLPDVAEIVCDGTTTEVLTPQVKPQPDGVHFRVDNRTEKRLGFDVRNGFGTGAEPGVHEIEEGRGMDITPGTRAIRCIDYDVADVSSDEGYVPLVIVDQDGMWAPDQLDCEVEGGMVIGHSDYVGGARGESGDPVDIAATHAEPGDEVRPAGYPDSESSKVVIIREGRPFSLLEFDPDGFGGWLLSQTTSCSPIADGSGSSGGGSSGSTGTG
jgi:hypothetical protein